MPIDLTNDHLNQVILHCESLLENVHKFSTADIQKEHDLIKIYLNTLQASKKADERHILALQVCDEGLDRELANRRMPKP